MKKNQAIETAVCAALAAVMCLLSVFWAIPTLKNKKSSASTRSGIVRLWNIDTFEGGKGSRTSFLNGVASAYEKANPGVYVMVSAYTAEGAEAAFSEGNYPDMISFGVGFSAGAEKWKKTNGSFAGGTVAGECRALPWCRGGYALFCLEDTFDGVNAQNTVISSGGSNLPLVAAALLPLDGSAVVEESTSAYVQFLNGKYKYMLGTQRDICRFASRGVTVYSKPLEAFSDLYQYIAVFAEEERDREICEGYIDCLLNDKNQKKLTSIGMLSVCGDIYNSDDPHADELERITPKFTVNVFTAQGGLAEINEAARSVLAGGKPEVLKNFLKEI